jgi:4-alpha-glucanotransferase
MLLPIQDVFGWADRINEPATINAENWTWRLPWPGERLLFEPEAATATRKLRAWSERYGRSLA